MKYDLPCEIVQDLLPNYVDDLLSDTSKSSVKGHLEACGECYEIYKAMNSKDENNSITINESKIIKKTRGKIIKIIVSCIVVFIISFIGIWTAYNWYTTSDFLTVDDYTLTVNKIMAEDITIEKVEGDYNYIMYFDGIESDYPLREDLVEQINEQGFIYQMIISSEKYTVDEVYANVINPDNSSAIEVWSNHKNKLKSKNKQRHNYELIYFDDISYIYGYEVSEDNTTAKKIIWMAD